VLISAGITLFKKHCKYVAGVSHYRFQLDRLSEKINPIFLFFPQRTSKNVLKSKISDF
jgi:hypothetical protein